MTITTSDEARRLVALRPTSQQICQTCGASFCARSTAKYCGLACRSAAWRSRNPGRNAAAVRRYQDRRKSKQQQAQHPAQQEEGA